MYKKGALVAVLLCSMSLTGCIVINTGTDEKSTKEESQPQQVTKHVIVDNRNDSSYTQENTTQSYSSKSRAYEVSGYIFYDSDTTYLTSDDLRGLSKWELKIARNEIYARRGRRFKNSDLQKYFDSCSWYNGYISADNFNDDALNNVEKYNVNLIKKYE